MARRFLPLLMALGVLVPSLAHAARFDLIVADEITMRAPLASWGITLAGTDFAIFVNRGATTVTWEDLDAARFTVEGVPVWPDTTTEMINPVLRPGFNPAFLWEPGVPQIVSHQAVGSLTPWNQVLLPLVANDETIRNSAPNQFLYFELGGQNNSPGVVRFDVTLRVGGDQVRFPIYVTLIDDTNYEFQFTHASRISSVTQGNTPVQNTSWGRVKSLYR